MSLRIGLGSDLHRLEPGNGIRLGGVLVPCPFSFVADSDGDIVLHALIDALLGALALGDIGDHFCESVVPRNDDSRKYLRRVLELPGLKKARLINIDCIIDLERPKLAEMKPVIRRSLAELLDVKVDRVSVKAKTAEKLGPVGEGLAAAAQVVVLLETDGDDDDES